MTNNKELKKQYRERGIIYRAFGGRHPKYVLYSFDYLPMIPKMTFFCRERVKDVEGNSKEFHKNAKFSLQQTN